MLKSSASKRFLSLGLIGAVLAPAAAAQAQFKHIPGSFPNPKKWTEGLECADVDNDGDLDVFFAEGNGYSSAGTKQQNVLVINKLELGPVAFTDESVARLGVHTSNARSADTGDIQGDGWVDAMFANGFNTDLPFLYVNRGAVQPGFFDFDGVARGFTTAYSSACSNFGDLDNDGDLDVIISDSGSSYLGGSGDRPHLYFNDGNGFFTEDAVAMNAPVKKAHMDVQYVDIDNDWDLDFLGLNRANNTGGNHYLMLNDGLGNFTNISNMLPGTSSNVYEAEVGDLDGDNDMDMFFVSLSGFSEGSINNNLNPSGTLSFSTGGTLSNSDDNEVILLDSDNDGDYDVIIGSLGSSEKLFNNNGSGVFSTVANDFTAVGDSTLDITVADVNNDGTYDVISAQGESGSTQWDAKLYANTGSADTVAPSIIRQEEVVSGSTSPWVVRSEMKDQVMDDGVHYVRAEVDYVVNTSPQTAAVTMPGLTYSPAVLNITAGTTVTWTNTGTGTTKHTVTSSTPGYEFDSGLFSPGETYSYTFVRPGTYDYVCTPHVAFGMVGQVIVTAAAGSVNEPALDMGGSGLFRFEMSSSNSGDLVYERRFTDWAGNVTVSPAVSVPVVGSGGSSGSFTVYGTGASPANYMSIAGLGSPQIGNAIQVQVSGITQSAVLLVISLNQTNTPLFGGVMLADFFSQLLPLATIPSAGGTGTWNGAIPNDPLLVGLDVFFQAGTTDGSQPGGFGMSDGLQLNIGL
ncbi:MAG: FG-GAP-like repeat-containing protein [Planctomycetota bacterium]|nr:FG-GAP-like repeat-containing protein [Planctomycetota bacterium]